MGQIEANQVLFVITEVKIYPVYLIASVADGCAWLDGFKSLFQAPGASALVYTTSPASARVVLFWYASGGAVRGLVRS